MREFFCLAIVILHFSSLSIRAQPEVFPRAWDALIREIPSLTEKANALERELLQLMTYEQLESYLEAGDGSEVILITGESLDSFLIRKGASSFVLPWYTIDGGGGAMTGGEYALVSALGQPDAGVMSGGNFTLAGGFLGFNDELQVDSCTGLDAIFCDGFESGNTAAW